MPSSNPRWRDWAGRKRAERIVLSRALAGEPCGICGQPIDLSLPQTYVDPADGKRKRHPLSLEVDEIVPIADGGSPTDPANVQPAHRVCNQKRGRKRLGTAPAARPSRAGRNSRKW